MSLVTNHNPTFSVPVIGRGHIDVIVYLRFTQLLSGAILQSVKINSHRGGLHVTNCGKPKTDLVLFIHE